MHLCPLSVSRRLVHVGSPTPMGADFPYTCMCEIWSSGLANLSRVSSMITASGRTWRGEASLFH